MKILQDKDKAKAKKCGSLSWRLEADTAARLVDTPQLAWRGMAG